MFGSKAMMAWSDLLGDAVCGKLDIQDRDEREKPFYREFSDPIQEVSEHAGTARRWTTNASSGA